MCESLSAGNLHGLKDWERGCGNPKNRSAATVKGKYYTGHGINGLQMSMDADGPPHFDGIGYVDVADDLQLSIYSNFAPIILSWSSSQRRLCFRTRGHPWGISSADLNRASPVIVMLPIAFTLSLFDGKEISYQRHRHHQAA